MFIIFFCLQENITIEHLKIVTAFCGGTESLINIMLKIQQTFVWGLNV